MSRRQAPPAPTYASAITVASFEQDEDGVDVEFSDGKTDRYDLVVGADGLHSQMRQLLFGDDEDHEPWFTGQAVWRALVPRPPDYTSIGMFYGPRNKAGANPVSDTQMYMFLVQNVADDYAPVRARRCPSFSASSSSTSAA